MRFFDGTPSKKRKKEPPPPLRAGVEGWVNGSLANMIASNVKFGQNASTSMPSRPSAAAETWGRSC